MAVRTLQNPDYVGGVGPLKISEFTPAAWAKANAKEKMVAQAA
jgi:hypothetical protein